MSVGENKREHDSELMARLAASREELRAMAHAVSHDLRAPLRHIRGFTEILLEDHGEDVPPDAKEILLLVKNAAELSNEMIEALLRFSRLLHTKLGAEPVSLDEVIGEALDGMDGAEIVVLRGPLPRVVGDRRALLTCLSELLDNALRYRRDGAAHAVRVSGASEAGRAYLRIEDNGPGIPQKLREQIFRVFERAGKPAQLSSVGMGLPLARCAAERMGGSLILEPISSEGSCFRLDLPAAE